MEKPDYLCSSIESVQKDRFNRMNKVELVEHFSRRQNIDRLVYFIMIVLVGGALFGALSVIPKMQDKQNDRVYSLGQAVCKQINAGDFVTLNTYAGSGQSVLECTRGSFHYQNLEAKHDDRR